MSKTWPCFYNDWCCGYGMATIQRHGDLHTSPSRWPNVRLRCSCSVHQKDIEVRPNLHEDSTCSLYHFVVLEVAGSKSFWWLIEVSRLVCFGMVPEWILRKATGTTASPRPTKYKQSNKAIGLVGTIARLFSDALPVTPFWASYIMILL